MAEFSTDRNDDCERSVKRSNGEWLSPQQCTAELNSKVARIAELEKRLAEVESCRKAANNALWEKSQAYELIRADWRQAVMDASQLRKDMEEMTKDRDIHKGMATGYMQLASKHETERDELTKQLADLRGDRDTLAKELNAYRDPEMCDCEPGVAAICEACEKVNAIIKATNESGALTRAGKDHHYSRGADHTEARR